MAWRLGRPLKAPKEPSAMRGPELVRLEIDGTAMAVPEGLD
jgi:hypothetical protein